MAILQITKQIKGPCLFSSLVLIFYKENLRVKEDNMPQIMRSLNFAQESQITMNLGGHSRGRSCSRTLLNTLTFIS